MKHRKILSLFSAGVLWLSAPVMAQDSPRDELPPLIKDATAAVSGGSRDRQKAALVLLNNPDAYRYIRKATTKEIEKIAETSTDTELRGLALEIYGSIVTENAAAVRVLTPAIASSDYSISLAASKAVVALVNRVTSGSTIPLEFEEPIGDTSLLFRYQLHPDPLDPETDNQVASILSFTDLAPLLARVLAFPDGERSRIGLSALMEFNGSLGSRFSKTPTAAEDTLENARRERVQLRAICKALRPTLRVLSGYLPAIADNLRSGDGEVRLLAAQKLYSLARFRSRQQGLRPDPLRKIFTELEPLNEPDLLLPGFRQTLPTLAAGLTDSPTEARLVIMDVIEYLASEAKPDAGAVIAATQDRSKFIRWAAARTLGRIRTKTDNESILSTLVTCLRDDEAGVRGSAMFSLQLFGKDAKSTGDAVAMASRTGAEEVRIIAIRTMAEIQADSPSAIQTLTETLSATDPRLRTEAAVTLGKLGPVARSALPALQKALGDESGEVREAVAIAILAIDKMK